MKKYTKISVVLVVMLLVSSIGFSSAFGYGSSRRIVGTVRPAITLAQQGRVLGESTMSTGAFISKLVTMGIVSPSHMNFINLLISLGIIK